MKEIFIKPILLCFFLIVSNCILAQKKVTIEGQTAENKKVRTADVNSFFLKIASINEASRGKKKGQI